MKNTTQQIIKEAKEKGFIPEKKELEDFLYKELINYHGTACQPVLVNGCVCELQNIQQRVISQAIDSFQLEKVIELAYEKLLQAEIERLEGEKVEPATGHPAQFNYDKEWYVGYNQALADYISLLQEEIKE